MPRPLVAAAGAVLFVSSCASSVVGLGGCSRKGSDGGSAPPPAIPVDPAVPPPDVLTWHYDLARTGVQPNERILTPRSVGPSTFGKLFAFMVDGAVYAQPLYVSNLAIGGATRDVIFIATQHDSVYAFDATGASVEPLWHVSLLQAGETPVAAEDVLTTDIAPEIGITGTPVIDRSTGALYVASKAARPGPTPDAPKTYVQRFHALGLSDGAEILGGPVEIAADVPGAAPDAVDGRLAFDALRENQRSALALIGGRVWITWAGHGDSPPFHGWLIGYDAKDLRAPPVTWSTTPNGGGGGIWMGAGAASADADGNMYVASANGTFEGDDDDEPEPPHGVPYAPRDWSSSTLRLGTDGGQISVLDSFTPRDQEVLSSVDQDYGTMAPIILPDETGTHPHRMLSASKSGIVYLLDRDDLGGYQTGTIDSLGGDRVLQSFYVGSRFFISNPALYLDTLYVCPNRGPLRAYTLDSTTRLFNEKPTSSAKPCLGCYVRGSAPTVSANVDKDGIVWILDNTAFDPPPGPAILHAHDAANVEKELFDSSVDPKNAAGDAVKFTTPVVANGRVYVGGAGVVTVYGLLAAP
jgi:hypothetical protein